MSQGDFRKLDGMIKQAAQNIVFTGGASYHILIIRLRGGFRAAVASVFTFRNQMGPQSDVLNILQAQIA